MLFYMTPGSRQVDDVKCRYIRYLNIIFLRQRSINVSRDDVYMKILCSSKQYIYGDIYFSFQSSIYR